MSKEIFFFASRADMLKSLSEIEQKRKIKYIKCGIPCSQPHHVYHRYIYSHIRRFETL